MRGKCFVSSWSGERERHWFIFFLYFFPFLLSCSAVSEGEGVGHDGVFGFLTRSLAPLSSSGNIGIRNDNVTKDW